MTTTELRDTHRRFAELYLDQPGVYGTRVQRRGGMALQVTVDPAVGPKLPNEFEGLPVKPVSGGPATLAYALS